MPPIQLNRLQSQTSALSHLINDPDAFCSGLLALLNLYEKKNTALLPISSKGNETLSLNVPSTVLSEIIKSIRPTVINNYPVTLNIVDRLWDYKILEMRLCAVQFLTDIDKQHIDAIIERIKLWLSPDMHESMLDIILSFAKQSAYLKSNETWWVFIESLTQSRDEGNVIVGLQLITAMLEDSTIFFPRFNNLLLPLIQHPQLKTAKYLLNAINNYRQASQPEAASLLMMAAQLYPSEEVFAFLRKSMRFFDDFFSNELRNLLP